MEPTGQELIQRYKANYGIPADSAITEAAILKHWELEKRLRHELLETTPDKRWETFERCYTELYSELDWLNQLTNNDVPEPPAKAYGHWRQLIGSPPMKVYEVGSGKGELISYLAAGGFECKATEITQERGKKWSSTHPNLTWGISDGIHLDQFEPTDFYDVVISNQVIEHMHPDDLLSHIESVFTILSSGGRYIFSTPHASLGPSDVSRVFRCDRPLGMHLKEYTYTELTHLLKQVGFKQLYAPLRLPKKIRRRFGERLKPRASSAYRAYLSVVEKLIATLPTQSLKRKTAKVSRLILFAPNLMMVAKK